MGEYREKLNFRGIRFIRAFRVETACATTNLGPRNLLSSGTLFGEDATWSDEGANTNFAKGANAAKNSLKFA
jgi:hypothetical protein